MAAYLIRHAQAEAKAGWEGPDEDRPLSGRGRRQADDLVEELSGAGIGRILTSPTARCRQTVAPLADRLGIVAEPCEHLRVGSDPERVVTLLEKGIDDQVALCTHGELIPLVIDALVAGGTRIDGERGNRKGSVWIIDSTEGRLAVARHHPPSS